MVARCRHSPETKQTKNIIKLPSRSMMVLELDSYLPRLCIDCKTELVLITKQPIQFAMVKLTSLIAFSAFVILPTFAAVIPISIETSVLSFFFLCLICNF